MSLLRHRSLARAVAAGTDPLFALVTSLMHFDGPNLSTTFTDQKPNTWSPIDSAALTTAGPKFGSACKNAAGYITSPTALGAGVGTGDFCIEGWFYPTAATNRGLFHTALSSSAAGIGVGHENVSGGQWQVYFNGTVQTASGIPLIQNIWQHFALERVSGTITLFIDGAIILTFSGAANITLTSLVWGAYFNNSFPFAAPMDECRATVGAHRYGAPFTPPAAAFPNS